MNHRERIQQKIDAALQQFRPEALEALTQCNQWLDEQLPDFSISAWAVMHAAHHRSLFSGNREIASEHLLGSVLELQDSTAASVLDRLGISREHFPQEIFARYAIRGNRVFNPVNLGSPKFAPDMERALQRAREEVHACGHSSVTTAYLLLGLAREETGTLGQVLKDAGIGIAQLRALAHEEMAES